MENEMDIRELDGKALEALRQRVIAVTDAELMASTPCAGWTVRDLLGHMNSEHEAITEHLLTPCALDPDPRLAFNQAADRWIMAFSASDILEQDIEVAKYGLRVPCQQLLSIHFADMLVHQWDLARATGVDPSLPADLVLAALPIVLAIPAGPPLRGPHGAYADAVPIPDDASATDRLVATLGRSPAWSAGPSSAVASSA
jgi:uncharacterized protein (TIGR03086 family)